MACSLSDQDEQWQHGSFAETNLCMLEKEIMCDVTFIAGKKEEPVRAHKFMLASRSPVFYAMFCGPLAESNEAIIVPDIETDILKIVIQYVYTAECELAGETVMALLYAAKKYEIQALVKDCSDFLHNNIEDENVCTILQQAIIFGVDDLVKKCLSYIFLNGPTVLESKGFLSLDREAVQRILESDDLDIDELSIYRACLDWARHQCTEAGEAPSDTNLRKTLGDVVYYIRFPIMASTDFTVHVSETGILTEAEKVSIFQSYFVERDTCGFFLNRTRCFKVDAVLARFTDICGNWYHNNTASVISFTCSRNVNLKGVYIFSPSRYGTVDGKLEISDDDSTLFSKAFCLGYEQGKQFEEIILNSPLKLAKEKMYFISQICHGEPTYYGLNGNRDVVVNGVKVTFSKTSKNNCGTNDENSGQFYGLHLV